MPTIQNLLRLRKQSASFGAEAPPAAPATAAASEPVFTRTMVGIGAGVLGLAAGFWWGVASTKAGIKDAEKRASAEVFDEVNRYPDGSFAAIQQRSLENEGRF